MLSPGQNNDDSTVSNDVHLDSNSCIHHGEALGSGGSGGSSNLSVEFWYEK